MHDQFVEALKGHKADYIEAHFEESEATHIVYRGERLEEVNRTGNSGGNVRALVKGGWGFVSFNSLERLRDKVSLAVEEAKLAGKEGFSLPSMEPVVNVATQFHPHSSINSGQALSPLPSRERRNSATVPLAAKKELLDEYNDIILSSPKIQSTRIDYRDFRRKVIFASSEGSYIEQSKPDLTLRLTAIARENNEVQQAGLSLGSKGDFSVIEGLHHQVRELARRAVALLSAPHVKGGEYTVILDPVLAGVFVHEAFGHLSESDFLYQNEQLRNIMILGRRFGGRQLNIVDDATIPDLRGSYKYDDEGMPASRTYLIHEGVLVGRLHSRETAAKMGESPTGNARAINYHFPPIVRMTNTFIEPGNSSFEGMLGDIKEGVYVKDWYGGTSSLEMFTFSAGEAYMIRQGKLAELLCPVVLSGNVFVTLGNIDAIGNDLKMNQGGGCGKGGQSPLPVSNGSPHIRVRSCLVGGK
ncbi:MAG: TldD/PmbA family protein [Dehalococcoidia bacterium]|nr:TldD/PmbA family protein [Dehalococcoidia bacterium]